MPQITETPVETGGKGGIGEDFSTPNEAPSKAKLTSSIPTPPPATSRTEIEAKAEEIKKARALPTKPGSKVTFEQLTQWLKLLTPEMETRISIYVYRLFPAIIRQRTNPNANNNIDVICDGFKTLSDEYFINSHGGGRYLLTLTDSDGSKDKKDNTNGFFSAKLEIPIQVHPPKLDIREVDFNNEINKGFQEWARAKGLIDNQNMPITPSSITDAGKQNGNGNSNNDNTVQLMKLFMEFIKEEKAKGRQVPDIQPDPMSKAMGEIFLEKVKQDDPNKASTSMMQMFTALVTAMKPDKSADSSQMTLVQMMMDNQKTNMQMMMELIKSNNESKGSPQPEGKFSEFKEMIEFAKEITGGSKPKQSTTELLIDKGLDVLGPVVNMVGNIMAIKMTQNGVKPVAPAPNLTPQQQAQVANMHQGLPQPEGHTEDMNRPTPGQPAPQSNESQQPMGIDLRSALAQFSPLILQNLTKDGWALPEMVANFYPQGDMLVAAIIKYGSKGIVDTMKTIPEFWNQAVGIYGEPHITQWVDDFVNYKQLIAQMDEDEDGGADGDEDEDDGTEDTLSSDKMAVVGKGVKN